MPYLTLSTLIVDILATLITLQNVNKSSHAMKDYRAKFYKCPMVIIYDFGLTRKTIYYQGMILEF